MKQTLAQFKARPLSYSSISSFEYDSERWYRSYILGERQTSKQLEFGSMIDKKIQNDPTFLPTLPRYEHMQYKMTVQFGDLQLVGIPDGLNLTNSKDLIDYKTGAVAWTQKRANETKQLDFYLLLLYITHKLQPEDFNLAIHWLPTVEDGDFSMKLVSETKFKTFTTKRTMSDILNFGAYIKKIHKEMCDFVENHE